MTTCGDVRTALGIYVLGAIEPAERGRVEGHLSTCPFCRDELAGMAGLPALLGRVSEAQIEHVAGPPVELLDSLLTRAAGERPVARIGRRWLAPMATAAAAIAVVGFLLGGLLMGGGGIGATPATSSPSVSEPSTSAPSMTSTPVAEQVVATDPKTHVRAAIGLNPEEWGTALAVRIDGAPAGTRCRMYALGKHGQRDPTGSWQVEEEGYGDYMASTMIPRSELKGFVIVTLKGQTLVSVNLAKA